MGSRCLLLSSFKGFIAVIGLTFWISLMLFLQPAAGQQLYPEELPAAKTSTLLQGQGASTAAPEFGTQAEAPTSWRMAKAEPRPKPAPSAATASGRTASSTTADVAYARSIAKPFPTETVISIKNTSDQSCDVTVDWIYGGTASLAGQSGPMALQPGETFEFTTANADIVIQPYRLNVFRDTADDFEGSGLIRSSCPSLDANATLVTKISGGYGSSYSSIAIAGLPGTSEKKVVEPKEPEPPKSRQPNDPDYGTAQEKQWGYSVIGMEQVWAETSKKPASPVTIAVIDDGIYGGGHPDLPKRSIYNARFLASGSDIGVGITAADSPTSQSVHHGTHVSGSILAKTNNSLGVAGTLWSPNADKVIEHISVRVLGENGAGTIDDIVQGIYYAAGIPNTYGLASDKPADVINLSLGGPGQCSPIFEEAIKAAVDDGSVVVVAAGNSGTSQPQQPASCPSVTLTVGATDINNQLADFSNYGFSDLSAPGVKILSTYRNGSNFSDSDYGYLDGTSMASPHVAGAVAVLLSQYPDLTPDQIKALLVNNARSFGDQRMGAGVLHLPEALADAAAEKVTLNAIMKENMTQPMTSANDPSYDDADFVPGEILVRYRQPQGVSRRSLSSLVQDINQIGRLGGVKIQAEIKRESTNPEMPVLINLVVPAGTSEQDLKELTKGTILELEQRPDLAYCQPNYILRRTDRA